MLLLAMESLGFIIRYTVVLRVGPDNEKQLCGRVEDTEEASLVVYVVPPAADPETVMRCFAEVRSRALPDCLEVCKCTIFIVYNYLYMRFIYIYLYLYIIYKGGHWRCEGSPQLTTKEAC